MPRPVKWSRDVHSIRERANRSRTETWSRADLERLFDIKPSAAQNLMKAIGEVQSVGGTHFVDRASLLSFLDDMISGDNVEEAVRQRLLTAEPPPAPKPLRISLPADLRNVMLRDLPQQIKLSQGRLEITAPNAVGMVENLALLAQALQNDLDSAQTIWDPPPASVCSTDDADIHALLASLRLNSSATS